MEGVRSVSNQLIEVKQLPVIVEQLHSIKKQFSEVISEALALECTSDTYKTVKKRRTDITATFNELESRRKEVKNVILAPYESFMKIYDDCVTNIYEEAKKQLDTKINDVTATLIAEKQKEVELYFNELCISKGIDFVTFANTGIKVNLTVSPKSLKEQAKSYLDGVQKDLELIHTQPEEKRAEMLFEYKNCFDIANAIKTVIDRHTAIEDEKAEEKNNEVLAAPTVEEEFVSEEIRSMTFTVKGTLPQLRALKAFIVENNIEIL